MPKSNEIKVAAIYLRSGREMKPQRLSLNEQQIEVLKNFAEEQNWQSINIYTDSKTGRKLGMPDNPTGVFVPSAPLNIVNKSTMTLNTAFKKRGVNNIDWTK